MADPRQIIPTLTGTIEDVAAFILDLLDEQKKGNLPYDLLFLWDSIGSIPCELSIRSNKNNTSCHFLK